MTTTFTSRSIRTCRWVRAVSVFSMIGCQLSLSAQSDIYLSGLVVYTKLRPGSLEAKEHGLYPQVKRYDLHSGMAPEKVDVVIVANGEPSGGVTIVLEVIPVVGLTNWKQTEGSTDTQLLENSKTEFPSVVRIEKTVNIRKRTEIKFEDIDMAAIINRYRKIGMWPAELIFRGTALPIVGETSIANNVMTFKVAISPPD